MKQRILHKPATPISKDAKDFTDEIRKRATMRLFEDKLPFRVGEPVWARFHGIPPGHVVHGMVIDVNVSYAQTIIRVLRDESTQVDLFFDSQIGNQLFHDGEVELV